MTSGSDSLTPIIKTGRCPLSAPASADALNLLNKALDPLGILAITDAADDILRPEIAGPDCEPMSTRKKFHALDVVGLHLHSPPLRVGGEFAPHVSTTAEEECPPKRVLSRIVQLRIGNNAIEARTVRIVVCA